MQVQPTKYVGLVADLMPNIRLMQGFGLFIFKYTGGSMILKKIYACTHLFLFLFQFACIALNLVQNTDDVNELTANTITILHFAHCMTKFIYVAINIKNFYK